MSEERSSQPQAPLSPEAHKAMEAFVAGPSPETVMALDSVVGRSLMKHRASLERLYGVDARSFVTFLGCEPIKIGRKRHYVGRMAAEFVVFLAQEPDLAVLVQRLEDASSAEERCNLAWALTQLHMLSGHTAALVHVYQKDALGTVEGIGDFFQVLRAYAWNDDSLKVPTLGPCVALLGKALKGKKAVCKAALYSLFCMVTHFHCDVTAILEPLVALLEGQKPAVTEAAIQIVQGQANNVIHQRTQYAPLLATALPLIAAHMLAKPGHVKVTSLQRAARSAFYTCRRLGQRVPPAQRQAFDEAIAAADALR